MYRKYLQFYSLCTQLEQIDKYKPFDIEGGIKENCKPQNVHMERVFIG